ncbi:M13 family metallopeptidase [Pseudoxanthomonas sangjuensis]|uniref:M13 family metallopeptidase n=1 Tax=Pseudoxanthomonas sangjuensis TaxID=1503750 RepID=UPI0013917DFA|nr:M13 family metallopeptidase [Pseudoxanthomonas sangjuensis]KAF1706870.1 peptidase M13 [Pseudoxanthomonas sangjuensis]
MPHLHDAARKPALLALALLAALSATDAGAATKKKKARAPATSAQCSDFYGYANADWLKANPAPSGIGAVTALGQLRELSLVQQRQLLDLSMQAPANDVQKRLGDFWASGLDEAAVEADGAKPIAPLLDRINAIRKSKDVPAAVAALHQLGIPVLFNFSADVDLQDLERHIGYFMQGGTGLSDPAFYTRTDAETRALLDRYRGYVKQILALTGTRQDRLDAEAAMVIDLETRIARQAQALQVLNDPFANYAPVEVASLAKTYRNLQLDAFLKVQGVRDDRVSLSNPTLFAALDSMVATLKPDQWKAYLRWRIGDAMAPYLARSFRDAEFDFRGRTLRGDAAPAERWQQVLDAITTAAGPMLGKEYAGRYLPSANRTRAADIAAQVRDALERGLQGNAWMSAEAKAEAKAKLSALKIEIGTPKRDLDYSVQPMGRGSFGSNVLIASTWRHREEMKRIGKGNADRRWNVLPQQPALAYDLAQNRLIVTAAVLQPPVFDAGKGDAALYGSFGALVGRELGRGFDRKGRMVDARGTLRDWWTPADLAAWDDIGNRVAAQYNAYPFPGAGAKVDGLATRDENVADLGGVELAWDAFTHARLAPDAAAKQDFFRAWSRLWAQHLSPAEATLRAAADIYAPGKWRSDGPLANLPAFAATFSCKAGQPMQLEETEQVKVWR